MDPSIILYEGTEPPEGYVPCDGRKLSFNGYENLAQRLGFMGGDVFAVPDLGEVGDGLRFLIAIET